MANHHKQNATNHISNPNQPK